MKRVLRSLLLAILPFGNVLADAPESKNAKVALVYRHELLNVLGKSGKPTFTEAMVKASLRRLGKSRRAAGVWAKAGLKFQRGIRS